MGNPNSILEQKNINIIKLSREERVALESRPKFIYIISGIIIIIIGGILYYLISGDNHEVFNSLLSKISPDFYLFVIAGFVAQMIDGALGMAYGVSASTFLLSFGMPPAAISASIHTSEIFTSGVSGLMHLKFGNVNKKLFRNLLIPGVLGAALGAYILSSLEAYSSYLKPIIALYTLYLGILILLKAIKGVKKKVKTKNIPLLATFGGFMDSIGGGGWGPIVSSTLIAGGRNPRYTVGSVNLAEFFVALASSVTFFIFLGLNYIQIILGLILGGVIAAPIAAALAKKLPVKTLMITVGVFVILLSLRILFLAIF